MKHNFKKILGAMLCIGVISATGASAIAAEEIQTISLNGYATEIIGTIFSGDGSVLIIDDRPEESKYAYKIGDTTISGGSVLVTFSN